MTGIVIAGVFRHLGNTTVNYPVISTVKRALNSELIANLSKRLNYAVIFLTGCMKEKRMRNDCNDISNYFSIRVSLVVSLMETLLHAYKMCIRSRQ